jgi:hypothetical protein
MPYNKQKSNGRRAPTATGNDLLIPYEEAVAEGKDIIKKMDDEQRRHQMRLGELADRVETKYGDRTLAKFAKEIGISACTLQRYLSVYRAWAGKGIEAPGPVSYAVLRELQDHPDREAIVKEDPKITKRKAQQHMRELKQQHERKQNKGKSGDWKADERKLWLRRVCSFANEHGRTAEEVMQNKEAALALREIAEPELLAALAADLRALLALVELVAHHEAPIEKAKRKEPNLKDAEREGVAA